jgi:hypothetical protein
MSMVTREEKIDEIRRETDNPTPPIIKGKQFHKTSLKTIAPPSHIMASESKLDLTQSRIEITPR